MAEDYDSPHIREAIATVLRKFADDIESGAALVIHSKVNRIHDLVKVDLTILDSPLIQVYGDPAKKREP